MPEPKQREQTGPLKFYSPEVENAVRALKTGDTGTKEQTELVIAAYTPHIKTIVSRYAKRSNPDFEDLVSAGYMGLLEALERFDARNASFSTYAQQRIEGAIIDHFRKLTEQRQLYPTGAVRRISELKKEISAARDKGIEPSAAELANRPGWSEESVKKYINLMRPDRIMPLPEPGSPEARKLGSTENEPSTVFARNEESLILQKAILSLRPREQQIIDRIYVQNLSATDIAGQFGISISRVCYLHRQALKKLRERIDGKIEGFGTSQKLQDFLNASNSKKTGPGTKLLEELEAAIARGETRLEWPRGTDRKNVLRAFRRKYGFPLPRRLGVLDALHNHHSLKQMVKEHGVGEEYIQPSFLAMQLDKARAALKNRIERNRPK